MNRIHVSGRVVKECRTSWLLTIVFVNGKVQPDGHTARLSKSRCEVAPRAGDFVSLWVPTWFHVKNRKFETRG